jgi:hypothetical protein
MLDVVAALSDGRILCEIVADVLYKLSKRLAGTTKPAKIVVRGVHRRPETRTLKLENVEKALALCRGIPELAQVTFSHLISRYLLYNFNLMDFFCSITCRLLP